MAHLDQDLVIDIRAIALYPARIGSLAGRSGVRFRCKKQLACTLVPCRVEALDGRSIAVPMYRIPDGTLPPRFRLQFDTQRMAVDERHMVCVVLSAERDSWKTDPEQTVLSPIFDDGQRMIYEFGRAYIMRIDKRGDVEIRFFAIDPQRGIVGTKTVYRFDTRLTALLSRCLEYLRGEIDLFPMRDRPVSGRPAIPDGEANLSFASPRRSRRTVPAASPSDPPTR